MSSLSTFQDHIVETYWNTGIGLLTLFPPFRPLMSYIMMHRASCHSSVWMLSMFSVNCPISVVAPILTHIKLGILRSVDNTFYFHSKFSQRYNFETRDRFAFWPGNCAESQGPKSSLHVHYWSMFNIAFQKEPIIFLVGSQIQKAHVYCNWYEYDTGLVVSNIFFHSNYTGYILPIDEVIFFKMVKTSSQ